MVGRGGLGAGGVWCIAWVALVLVVVLRGDGREADDPLAV